jgi:hypothetical protein
MLAGDRVDQRLLHGFLDTEFFDARQMARTASQRRSSQKTRMWSM